MAKRRATTGRKKAAPPKKSTGRKKAAPPKEEAPKRRRKAAPKEEAPKRRRKAAPPKEEAAASSKTAGWFARGKDGFDQKRHEDALSDARRAKSAHRFYLKTKKKADAKGPNEFGVRDDRGKIVFLDTEGFFIKEHNLQIDGKWGNHYTCTQDREPCEVCQQRNDRAGLVGFWSIIDTRKYRRQSDGEISHFRKSLFPAKSTTIELIEELAKEKGNLRGVVVEMRRIGDKEPAVGSQVKYLGRISEAKLKKMFGQGENGPEMITKYDYMEKLAPPESAELVDAGVVTAGSVGDDADVEYDDDDSGLLDNDEDGGTDDSGYEDDDGEEGGTDDELEFDDEDGGEEEDMDGLLD